MNKNAKSQEEEARKTAQTMPDRILPFPRPADLTIEDVLEEFLREQRLRLKNPTFRTYQFVMKLFQASLNNYAYQPLNPEETRLFEHYYDAKGAEHREFCQIFGPEKIPENVGEFLDYFMRRKVICGKERKQAAARIMRKLNRWLRKKGYLMPDKSPGRRKGRSKSLPPTPGIPNEILEKHFLGGFSLRDEANAIVAYAFRNGPIEKLHAGEWSELLTNERVSRLTDEDIKTIMIYACDKVEELLRQRLKDPNGYLHRLVSYNLDYCEQWKR